MYTSTVDIQTIAETLVENIFFYTCFFAFTSFVLSVYATVRLNKNGFYNRPNIFWTFISKCIMIYLPVVITFTGGAIGAVYGMNTTVTDVVGHELTNLIQVLSQGEIVELGFVESTIMSFVVDAQFDYMYAGIVSFAALGFLKVPFIEFMVFNIYKVVFGFNQNKSIAQKASLV